MKFILIVCLILIMAWHTVGPADQDFHEGFASTA